MFWNLEQGVEMIQIWGSSVSLPGKVVEVFLELKREARLLVRCSSGKLHYYIIIQCRYEIIGCGAAAFSFSVWFIQWHLAPAAPPKSRQAW